MKNIDNIIELIETIGFKQVANVDCLYDNEHLTYILGNRFFAYHIYNKQVNIGEYYNYEYKNHIFSHKDYKNYDYIYDTIFELYKIKLRNHKITTLLNLSE